MNLIGRFFIILYLLVLSVIDANAYDEETHFDYNEKIAQITDNDSRDLGSYLTKLGFKDGIDTKFCSDIGEKNCERAYIWLGLGGKYEDQPAYMRSRNHFHNPLESWDASGLDHLIFSGASSILWSQDQSERRVLDRGGDWSWVTARSVAS